MHITETQLPGKCVSPLNLVDQRETAWDRTSVLTVRFWCGCTLCGPRLSHLYKERADSGHLSTVRALEVTCPVGRGDEAPAVPPQGIPRGGT